MATSNVNVAVATEIRTFPLSTVPGDFLFELVDKTGAVISSTHGLGTTVTFPKVPQGEKYTIRVSRVGVVASVEFTVPLTVNEIAVPVSVTVSFAAVSPTV